MSDHENDPLGMLNKRLRESKIYSGEEITPEDAAKNFLRLRAPERASFLNELDERLGPDTHLSLLEAQKLHRYRSRLIHAHEQALKVKR